MCILNFWSSSSIIIQIDKSRQRQQPIAPVVHQPPCKTILRNLSCMENASVEVNPASNLPMAGTNPEKHPCPSWLKMGWSRAPEIQHQLWCLAGHKLSLGVSAVALDRIDCTRGVEGRVLIIQKTLTTVSSIISIISLLLYLRCISNGLISSIHLCEAATTTFWGKETRWLHQMITRVCCYS